MTALTKDGNGGYVSPDGRWTVNPVQIGAGVNNNKGWSKGHREWRLTDTTGQATLSVYGNRSQVILGALWRVRDMIEAVEKKEGQ